MSPKKLLVVGGPFVATPYCITRKRFLRYLRQGARSGEPLTRLRLLLLRLQQRSGRHPERLQAQELWAAWRLPSEDER